MKVAYLDHNSSIADRTIHAATCGANIFKDTASELLKRGAKTELFKRLG